MKRLDVIIFDMCRNVQTVLDEHLTFCAMRSAIIPKAFSFYARSVAYCHTASQNGSPFKIEIYKHQRQHSR